MAGTPTRVLYEASRQLNQKPGAHRRRPHSPFPRGDLGGFLPLHANLEPRLRAGPACRFPHDGCRTSPHPGLFPQGSPHSFQNPLVAAPRQRRGWLVHLLHSPQLGQPDPKCRVHRPHEFQRPRLQRPHRGSLVGRATPRLSVHRSRPWYPWCSHLGMGETGISSKRSRLAHRCLRHFLPLLRLWSQLDEEQAPGRPPTRRLLRQPPRGGARSHPLCPHPPTRKIPSPFQLAQRRRARPDLHCSGLRSLLQTDPTLRSHRGHFGDLSHPFLWHLLGLAFFG